MLSKPRLIVPLLALLVALLAGCGGGQSGGSQSGEEQDGGGGQQESKKEARETKIAIGNVVSVKPDKRRIAVRPSRQVEGAERVVFKVRKNAEITLGGEKAEVADIAEGQQAQAEYVVKNDVNRAVSVQLFEAEEQPSGEEGTSN